jgi:hypothetical protein
MFQNTSKISTSWVSRGKQWVIFHTKKTQPLYLLFSGYAFPPFSRDNCFVMANSDVTVHCSY